MDKVWLPDILADGTLTDNSVLSTSGTKEIKIQKNGTCYKSLHRPQKGQHSKKWNDEGAIWNFLTRTHFELKQLLTDDQSLRKHLVFFGSANYEHNTADPLFDLEGTGFKNWILSTGNLVGFVKGEGKRERKRYNYSLKVSSRFGDNFLKALIADAEGFLEMEDFGGSGGQSDMEWLLHYFWKIKLKRAFRLGIPKAYRSKKEKLPTVRGNIDLLDFTLNGQQTATYLCSYREHSYNHSVNQLIHTAFQKVKSSALLQDTAPIQRAFATAVKGEKISLRALQKVQKVNNPYYNPYNEVIDLSRKLLRDEFADFEAKSDTNALFFDVSMLFEYFIRKIVRRAGCYVHQKEAGDLLQIPSGGNYKKGKRALYPDLVFDDENGGTHVFDVKYKRYDFTYGVKREDLFQVHTYLGQVANNHNVVRCGLIYPVGAENERAYPDGVIKDHFKYRGKKVCFEVHFFRVPDHDCKDYKAQFIRAKDKLLHQLLKTHQNG
jgi:5-methylcytosine-specific restriction endonuclease McrBC regulatory subunit McrC